MSAAAVSALANDQARLVHALLARPDAQNDPLAHGLPAGLDAAHPQARRGWLAYRANAQAQAHSALASAYPVIHALLGPETLTRVARDLWHRHPPVRGDLAQWGAALPVWLERCKDLEGLPYLSDVARTEWALHQAATARDATADLASFARLAHEDPAGIGLALAPGTAVVVSRFPVVSVIAAHRPDGPDLATAGRRLQAGVAETALIWRQGLAPRLAACHAPATRLVLALLGGSSLLQALEVACDETATDHPPFDFSAWLHDAVATGLVLGVRNAADAASVNPGARP